MDSNNSHAKPRQDDMKTDSKSNVRVVSDTNTSCGCGPCKPSWIQLFANPAVFTAHSTAIVGLVICCYAYMGGVLTTIERRFQLSSSESGILSIINDVVLLSFVLFASYFGHRSHRPRLIGAGTVICGLGFVLFSMPHFTSDPLDPRVLMYGKTQRAPSVCHVESSSTYGTEYRRWLRSIEGDTYGSNNIDTSNLTSSTQISLSPLVQPKPSDMTNNYTYSNGCESSSGGLGSTWWIILGSILAGIGASPMYPLITTYIDDAVGKHRLVSYTGFLLMSFSFGPAIGFLLSAQTTKLYVDFDRVSADHIPDIPQHDPRWIGAWWLGFAFLGSLLMLLGIPMFLYPKVMINTGLSDPEDINEKEDDKEEDNTRVEIQDNILQKLAGQDGIVDIIKSLLFAMKRLLTNKTLVLLCLSACAETATLGIIAAFAVKYLQTQFRLSPGTSAMLMGGAIIPCNIISNLSSAYICRRFKLNSRQCVIFVMIAFILSGTTLPILLTVGCENPEIAGITMPYSSFGEIDQETTPFHLKQNTSTLITEPSTCNAGCSCTTNEYQPVCGSDGITYISACFAGCTEKTEKTSQILMYTNCSCTSGSSGNSSGSAKSGQCPSKCPQSKLVTFVVLYALSFFMMASTGNPLIFVALRCVDDGDRSIALGLKTVITKVLGFFPSPVYFGAIINSTCLYWQYTCGERGACWIYDIVKYRFSYFGTLLILRTLGLFVYALVYFSIKPEEPKTRSEDRKHADETIHLQSDNIKKDEINQADNL